MEWVETYPRDTSRDGPWAQSSWQKTDRALGREIPCVKAEQNFALNASKQRLPLPSPQKRGGWRSCFAALLSFHCAGRSSPRSGAAADTLLLHGRTAPGRFRGSSRPAHSSVLEFGHRKGPSDSPAPGGVRATVQKMKQEGKFIARSYSLEGQESS